MDFCKFLTELFSVSVVRIGHSTVNQYYRMQHAMNHAASQLGAMPAGRLCVRVKFITASRRSI